MARIAKKTKRYPSDLTDEEWDRIAPLMPRPGRRGRPREVDFRKVINAVRYLVRSSSSVSFSTKAIAATMRRPNTSSGCSRQARSGG
jgi:hypothetical protein